MRRAENAPLFFHFRFLLVSDFHSFFSGGHFAEEQVFLVQTVFVVVVLFIVFVVQK